jgi:hypothetical protein
MPETTATTPPGTLEANTTKRLDFVNSTAEDSDSITDTTAPTDSESAPVSQATPPEHSRLATLHYGQQQRRTTLSQVGSAIS